MGTGGPGSASKSAEKNSMQRNSPLGINSNIKKKKKALVRVRSRRSRASTICSDTAVTDSGSVHRGTVETVLMMR